MDNEINNLRSFGKFQLDAEKKVLWFENEPVNLALKEVELLCVLTEHGGEVITKDELMNKVWADSFVEENNLDKCIFVTDVRQPRNLEHQCGRQRANRGSSDAYKNRSKTPNLLGNRYRRYNRKSPASGAT